MLVMLIAGDLWSSELAIYTGTQHIYFEEAVYVYIPRCCTPL